MNINGYYNGLPEYDDFLTISIDKGNQKSIIPNFKKCDEACICVYNVSEAEIADYLASVEKRSFELISEIKKNIGDKLWDLELKPIFLFEDEKSLLTFLDFSNQLNKEAFFEMISELQLAFNEPWKSVRRLTYENVLNIISDYNLR